MALKVGTLFAASNRLLAGYSLEKEGYFTFREKGTPNFLLIACIGGKGRIAWPESNYEIGPGEAVLFEPRVMHDYRLAPGAKKWEMLWAHFIPRPHWMPLLAYPEVSTGRRVTAFKNVEIPFHFERCISASQFPGPLAELEGMNALESVLIRLAPAIIPSTTTQLDSRIEQAMKVAGDQLRLPITVNMLAKAVNLSESRFGHLFRDQVGLGASQYLQNLRMEKAVQLLEHSSLSIKAIAAAVGYQNAFYFTNRFRERFGVSPSRFRLQGEALEV